MEEITEEATFICDDLDSLLREADKERVRDLQEGPSNSVVSGPLYPKLSMCFEGAQLTQLVQLVTADRLFPCHKGRVDL